MVATKPTAGSTSKRIKTAAPRTGTSHERRRTGGWEPTWSRSTAPSAGASVAVAGRGASAPTNMVVNPSAKLRA
jgi:hypothetical protein